MSKKKPPKKGWVIPVFGPEVDEVEERVRRHWRGSPDHEWLGHLLGIIDRLREGDTSDRALEAGIWRGRYDALRAKVESLEGDKRKALERMDVYRQMAYRKDAPTACPTCRGLGQVIDMGGDPDDCSACGGAAVKEEPVIGEIRAAYLDWLDRAGIDDALTVEIAFIGGWRARGDLPAKGEPQKAGYRVKPQMGLGEWWVVNEAGEQVAVTRVEKWAMAITAALQDAPTAHVNLEDLRKVLEALNHEDDPCRFDHHGYCQSHGWMSTEECYVKTAKRLLAALPEEIEKEDDNV